MRIGAVLGYVTNAFSSDDDQGLFEGLSERSAKALTLSAMSLADSLMNRAQNNDLLNAELLVSATLNKPNGRLILKLAGRELVRNNALESMPESLMRRLIDD